jgi:hypothetical protein
MTMARRRTRSHLELREQFDAAERRKAEDEEADDEEEADEADDEEEEEEESAEDEEAGDEDDEEKPKKKPAKKKAAPKEAKPKRTRAPKVVRQKVVWAVFNNSNQRVATYDYPKKQEAHDHAARLQAEKKQTFFVQPVKEPIEEKKEK